MGARDGRATSAGAYRRVCPVIAADGQYAAEVANELAELDAVNDELLMLATTKEDEPADTEQHP